MSLRWLIVFALISFNFMAQNFAAAKDIQHEVQEDETAWFLADLYYGSGKHFQKLLISNKLQRAEELKPGQVISIEEAVFTPEQSGFEVRKSKLWNRRQKALGLARPDNASAVYLPTDKIRSRDKTDEVAPRPAP